MSKCKCIEILHTSKFICTRTIQRLTFKDGQSNDVYIDEICGWICMQEFAFIYNYFHTFNHFKFKALLTRQGSVSINVPQIPINQHAEPFF